MAIQSTKKTMALAGTLADLMININQMAFASAQTIFHRTAMMLSAGMSPTAMQRKEFMQMGSEKIDAATASTQAIFKEWYSFTQQLIALGQAQWNIAMAMASFASVRTMEDLMSAQTHYLKAIRQGSNALLKLWAVSARAATNGLKPVHSRASANAKRLIASAGRASSDRK